MDTFKSKKEGFSKDALLKKNQAASKMKETTSSFRDTIDENTKIDDKSVQFNGKNVKVDGKNLKLENKDIKIDDKNLTSKYNRYTNNSSYDLNNGYSTVDVKKTQKEVYSNHTKEHVAILPPINESSDLNRTKERYQTDSRNLSDSIKDDAVGYRSLHNLDHDIESQADEMYKNTLYEGKANKEIITNKEKRLKLDKVSDNLQNKTPYNTDDYRDNGNHSKASDYRTHTSRDNHGNEMDEIYQASKKHNSYQSNQVKTVANDASNSRRSKEKHKDIQLENDSKSQGQNGITSSMYREAKGDNIKSKQPGTSRSNHTDHEDEAIDHNSVMMKNSVSQPDNANLNNKSYNAKTSHGNETMSRHVKEDNNILNEKYNIKQSQLNTSGKTTIKDTEGYQRNDTTRNKKSYNPVETSNTQTSRHKQQTNKKEITAVASQIDNYEDNYDRRNYVNNKAMNSTFTDERKREDDGRSKPRSDQVINYSSYKRGTNFTNGKQKDDAHRRRKEYVKRHYDGAFEIFSDDDDDEDKDKVLDKGAVMNGKGNLSLFHDSQEDGDDDDDDDDRYCDGEMLDQSSVELKATIDELERRFDTIENEGNEWKTRFETQTEMNQQLEKQILLLQEKVEEAKRNLKEAGKSPWDNRVFDDLADASPQMVKSLERERNSLFSQLRDLEWRLDQESKAYHKANDERKQYVLEINATKVNVGEPKSRQRQTMLNAQEAPPRITSRSNPGDSPRTYRNSGGNIPDGQRILDPRYGPIRKTAAVKALPSLD